MAQASVTKIDHKTRWSEAEWETRVQLAACYRLVARYRMTDTIYTHISARVPGVKDQFLLNPYGLMFDEITASSLVKIDLEGRLVEESDYRVNAAGFTIHSAIHAARHDVVLRAPHPYAGGHGRRLPEAGAAAAEPDLAAVLQPPRLSRLRRHRARPRRAAAAGGLPRRQALDDPAPITGC